jgi:hypothetical protein
MTGRQFIARRLPCWLAAALSSAAVAQEQFPEPFDVGASYTAELVVAQHGNDSSGMGSADAPYATIARALAEAKPGTRVRVLAGTYGPVGSTRNVEGTTERPIAIVADGAVVIDGRGEQISAWHIANARSVVIDGFTIQNTGIHGINIDDGGDATPSEQIALRNLTFRDIGSGGNNDCLKLSGVDHFFVSSSAFEGCNRGEAIDMVGCHDGVVAGNDFRDLPFNAVGTKGGSADVLIHGNRFLNIAQRGVNAGGATGSEYFRPLDAAHEATRIRIVANVFERTSPPVAFAGCDACVFAHNTVIEPRRWLARIVQENASRRPSTGGQVVNNLIVFTSRYMNREYIEVGPNTEPQTFVVGSNLWYSLDNPRVRSVTLGAGLGPETASLYQADPLLADVRGGDFRVRAGSPALRAGRPLAGGTYDYLRRRYQTPPTVGAFAEPSPP